MHKTRWIFSERKWSIFFAYLFFSSSFVCLFVCLFVLSLVTMLYVRHVLCCQMADKLTALLILTTLPTTPCLSYKTLFVSLSPKRIFLTFLVCICCFLMLWCSCIIVSFLWFLFHCSGVCSISFDIFISLLKGLGLKCMISKGCSETHFLDPFSFISLLSHLLLPLLTWLNQR